MIFDDDIEKMFKSVADSLKLGYQKFKPAHEEFHNFIYKEKILVSLVIAIDPYKGNINFLTRGPDKRSFISWGSFKKEELTTKAKKVILSKLKELIIKQ